MRETSYGGNFAAMRMYRYIYDEKGLAKSYFTLSLSN